jgi:hypothetical protein
MTSTVVAAAGGLFALVATACSTPEPTAVRALTSIPALGEVPAYPYGGWYQERTVQYEMVEVCKDYVGGSGPDVVFDVDVTGHDNTSTQVTVPAGECRLVWLEGGTNTDNVTVTENVPAGYTASFVETTLINGVTTVGGTVNGTSGSAVVDGTHGALFVFTNTPVPPPSNGCTLTLGYWKTHPEDWDQAGDPNTASFITGTTFYNSGKTYLEILNTPPAGGTAYIILAHQFIAAELNVGAGASTTPAVDAALSGAAAYFAGAPAGIPKPTGALRDQLISWADILDSYNNGFTGPGHCSD